MKIVLTKTFRLLNQAAKREFVRKGIVGGIESFIILYLFFGLDIFGDAVQGLAQNKIAHLRVGKIVLGTTRCKRWMREYREFVNYYSGLVVA